MSNRIPFDFVDAPEDTLVAPTTAGEAGSASANLSGLDSPVMSAARIASIWELSQKSNKLIPPQELNQMYPHLAEPFTEPVNQFVAQHIADQQYERMKLQMIIESGPKGGFYDLNNFAAAMVPHAIDPANVAAGFITGGVFSYMRGAKFLKSTKNLPKGLSDIGNLGAIARTKATVQTGRELERLLPAHKKFGLGFIDGFVGNVMVEPLTVHAARLDKSDYTVGDALTNSIAGAVLFPGIRFGLHKGMDILRKLGPEKAEIMNKMSYSQLAQDKVVNLNVPYKDMVLETNNVNLKTRQDFEPLNIPRKFEPLNLSTVQGSILFSGQLRNISDVKQIRPTIINEDFGDMIYLTDSDSVANGIAGSKYSKNVGSIATVQIAKGANILDLNVAFPKNIMQEIAEVLRQNGIRKDELVIGTGKFKAFKNPITGQKDADEVINSGSNIFDQIRAFVGLERLPEDIFDQIHARMNELGYDGYTRVVKSVGGHEHHPYNEVMLFGREKLELKDISDARPREVNSLSQDELQGQLNATMSRTTDIDYDPKIDRTVKDIELRVDETKAQEQMKLTEDEIKELDDMIAQKLFDDTDLIEIDNLKQAMKDEETIHTALKGAAVCLGEG